MEYIIIILGLILLILCVYLAFPHNSQKNHQKKVHFYVARDRDKSLWLYMGEPIRADDDCFMANTHGKVIASSPLFKDFGLNRDDYKDITWEDEPVEVFLNLEG